MARETAECDEGVMQIPPAAHPTWADLVTGKVKFEPSFLAARMFIVRVRMEVGKAGAKPELIRKHATGLRDLLAQNADCASVQQDIAKIFK